MMKGGQGTTEYRTDALFSVCVDGRALLRGSGGGSCPPKPPTFPKKFECAHLLLSLVQASMLLVEVMFRKRRIS